MNLGVVAEEEGDLARAAVLHEESLEQYRQLHDQWGIAAALANLGLVAGKQGDADRAAPLLEEGLARFAEIGDPSAQLECLEALAGLARERGVARRATYLYAAAATLREALGLPATDGAETARVTLGVEFDTAWQAGRAMTPLEALAAAPTTHALLGPDGSLAPPRATRPG